MHGANATAVRIAGRISWRPAAGPLWGALVPLLLLLVAGCGRDAEGRAALGEMRGVELSPPIPKPDFQLVDTDGRPFGFRERTDGYVTLLFFGYTHCPDICPLHMANIAAVLRRMPFEQRERVKVVFVTTDPERDTPDHLRRWLDGFDPSFIGVTGSREEIAVAERTFNLRPAAVVPAGDDGDGYAVAHAAQVIAFTADDHARFLYPFGIRQQDWANDLPRLVEAVGGRS